MNDKETQQIKFEALMAAREFIIPIVEDHPPKSYKIINQPGGGPLSIPPSTEMTAAEQVLSLTMEVANWLLEP